MAAMPAVRVLGLSIAFLLAGCAQPVPPDDATQTGGDGSQLGGGAGAGGASPIEGGGGGAGSGGGGSAGGGSPPSSGGSMSGPSGPSGPGAPSGEGGGDSSSSSGGTGVTYEVGRAIHEDSWLCQTAVTVNDLTPAGTDGQECLVTLTFTDTTVTVVSTGIPNHNFESGSGCCTEAQSSTNSFPLTPEIAQSVTYPSQRGSQATAVNGVAIFGPEDSNGADVVIATYTTDDEPRLATCDAHSEPMSGVYHYHADGNCIHYHGSMADYDFSKVDSSAHSKIIGWVPDGFPIYGSYGYAEDGETVKEMVSSYRFKDGADGSNGQEDQEYVEGLGDLDECNGHTGPTPEFPDGIYHYHSTKSGGGGGLGFPYFPLCYRGVVPSSGGMTGGSSGGTTSGGGGGMPPSGGGSSTSGSMSGTQSGPPPPPPGGGGPGGGGGGMPPPPP